MDLMRLYHMNVSQTTKAQIERIKPDALKMDGVQIHFVLVM